VFSFEMLFRSQFLDCGLQGWQLKSKTCRRKNKLYFCKNKPCFSKSKLYFSKSKPWNPKKQIPFTVTTGSIAERFNAGDNSFESASEKLCLSKIPDAFGHEQIFVKHEVNCYILNFFHVRTDMHGKIRLIQRLQTRFS